MPPARRKNDRHPTAQTPAAGRRRWVLLFNGKDLTGWLGDTRLCRVEKETLIAQPNDHGLSLRSERRDFKNFVLHFEHQVEPAGESVPVLNVLLHGRRSRRPGETRSARLWCSSPPTAPAPAA